MIGGHRALKYCAVILLLSVFSLLTILSLPPLQNHLWKQLFRVLSKRTGWAISAQAVYFAPWGTLYADNIYIGLKERQVAVCKNLRLSFSFSTTFPFIKPGSLHLAEPLIISEVDDSGALIWPPLPSSQGEQRNSVFEKGHSFFIPGIQVIRGRVVVLKNGLPGYHIKDLTGEILPDDRGDRIFANLSLEGFVDKPLLGRVKLRGRIDEKEKGVDFKIFSLELPEFLEGTLYGSWDFRSLAGNVSFHLLYFDPTRHPLTRKLGGNPGIITLKAKADFNLRGAKGFVVGESSSGQSIEAAFDLRRDDRTGFFFFTASGRYAAQSVIQSSGAFSLKGYLADRKSYYALINLRCGHLGAAGAFKEFASKIEGAEIRVELLPGGIALSPASFATVHGMIELRGLLSYGTGSKFADGVRFSLRWSSAMGFSGIKEFGTKGRVTGICAGECGSGLDRWAIEGEADLSREDEKIEFSGTFAKGEMNVAVGVKSVRLDNLPALSVLLKQPVGGTVSGKAALKGAVRAPELTVDSLVEGLHYGVYKAEKITVSGHGRITREGFKSVKLNVYGLSVPEMSNSMTVEAFLAQQEERLNFDVKVSLGRGGNFTFKGNVLSLWSAPEVIIEKGNVNWNGSYGVTGVFKIKPGSLGIDRLTVYHGDGSVSLKGKVESGGEVAFNSTLNRFPLDDVLSSLGLETKGLALTGELGGALREGGVNFNARVSLGKGAFRLPGFSGAPSKMYGWDEVDFKVALSENVLSASATVSAPYWQEPLRLSAFLPVKILRISGAEGGNRNGMALVLSPLKTAIALDPVRPFECKIAVKELDLGFFEAFYSERLVVKGRFSADVSVEGRLSDLHARGGGSVKIDKLYPVSRKDILIEEVGGNFSFVDNVLKVEEARGRLLEGFFRLNALVPLASGFEGATVNVDLRDVRVPEIYGATGVVSGNLTGTLQGGGFDVKGDFVASRASMDLEALKDELTRDIRPVEIVDEEGEVGVIEEKSSEGIYDNLSMDVGVDFSRGKATVKGLGVDAEVEGRLSFKKRKSEPLRIYGTIGARRGSYAFQSVRLKITEGEVRFKGTNPPDPEISFRGEKSVGDVTINVLVIGTVSEPVLKLSSSPPMNDVDILSYLLFSRPARNLTAKENMNLQENAAFFIGSKATQKLKEVLGNTPFAPDVLEIHSGESGNGIVEVGKYLTPDFYVTYEKDLKDEGKDRVKLEYRINRHLSVQSQIGSERGAGVDVLWRHDFGE